MDGNPRPSLVQVEKDILATQISWDMVSSLPVLSGSASIRTET
jgi:hypothetical protein